MDLVEDWGPHMMTALELAAVYYTRTDAQLFECSIITNCHVVLDGGKID